MVQSTATWARPGGLDIIGHLRHTASAPLVELYGSENPMLTTVGTPWCRAVQDAVLCVVDCPHNCFGRNLSANQGRVRRKGRAKMIHDTHMSTTREHGRTTRMHKVGRYNCAHAEDCEGRKKYKVSKARRIENLTSFQCSFIRTSAPATGRNRSGRRRADTRQMSVETHSTHTAGNAET